LFVPLHANDERTVVGGRGRGDVQSDLSNGAEFAEDVVHFVRCDLEGEILDEDDPSHLWWQSGIRPLASRCATSCRHRRHLFFECLIALFFCFSFGLCLFRSFSCGGNVKKWHAFQG
jgi:hypothetical protein